MKLERTCKWVRGGVGGGGSSFQMNGKAFKWMPFFSWVILQLSDQIKSSGHQNKEYIQLLHSNVCGNRIFCVQIKTNSTILIIFIRWQNTCRSIIAYLAQLVRASLSYSLWDNSPGSCLKMFDPGESPQFESGSGHLLLYSFVWVTISVLSHYLLSSFLMVAVKLWSMTVNEQTGASLMKCNLYLVWMYLVTSIIKRFENLEDRNRTSDLRRIDFPGLTDSVRHYNPTLYQLSYSESANARLSQ